MKLNKTTTLCFIETTTGDVREKEKQKHKLNNNGNHEGRGRVTERGSFMNFCMNFSSVRTDTLFSWNSTFSSNERSPSATNNVLGGGWIVSGVGGMA